MARQVNTATAERKKVEFELMDFEIKYPHWLNDNSACFFTLDLPTMGISFRDMTLRYDKEGRAMILPGSTKGKDGKWYNNYYINMSSKMIHAIVDQLEAM